MSHPQLDRFQVLMRPLAERENKKRIERDRIEPGTPPHEMPDASRALVAQAAERILVARAQDRPAMLAFGAHTIKNGLGPVLSALAQKGWITHLATNGAGVIHDWEFAYLGESSEDVRVNVARGRFGNWQETGFYINLAINVGAYEGKGYGEAVGAFIQNGELRIPGEEQLLEEVREQVSDNPDQAAAAAQMLHVVRTFELEPGIMHVPHPYRRFSVQAAAYKHGIPSTDHPMIGHDIIYNHPMNNGMLLGRGAMRDFLTFAHGISRIEGGVYLSLGSAVMSPMIFEKSLSMSQNIALQEGRAIRNHYILVVDLAKSHWDWTQGEPPETNPDYYLRYNKSFNRMGGEMHYLSADNRDFLCALYQELDARSAGDPPSATR